jgi:hypothetical protein
MGRERRRLVVVGSVSRHNSDQDVMDDFLWEELRGRIEAICAEHRYEPLDLDV